MKVTYWFFILVSIIAITVCVTGNHTAFAQDPLKMGTILKRANISGAPNLDAILVLREVPGGGESGWHTQAHTEIVYILEGTVVFQVKGKPDVTLKAGEAFETSAGQVHNVKNGSATEGAKALAFYIAKKDAKLEDLSHPVK